MKSKLKLAIYEACENGVISAEDAQTYLEFVECADLEDASDVDVLTEMVDAISMSDEDVVYESAEDYVLDYLMEKCGKGEAAKGKCGSGKPKKDSGSKVSKLKAKIAANKGKIAAGTLGAAALAGGAVAGVKNKDKIIAGAGKGKDALKALAAKMKKGKGGAGAEDDVDTSYVDAFGSTESVQDLIYESVECGDITVSEAADLLDLLV